ncbi:polyprenyl synthetase family protein [Ruminococcus albus]|uniref:Farnesyl diphosphate synthase n=1 Tax=Ruminococcus albus (strain ATCC 27210 / DSM 20455 / JCM 14654 / NCDO 2250 / 7) TaxID=697329 RepID=E6UAN6_RUMA7|nr:farnesyl diphosphate synthase [Ruminococcus albus]ADU22458.1 Polyprenyl synthetase [Ruminococcus albus 7 = DSM 20455]
MTDRHEQLLKAYCAKIDEQLLRFTENKPELQSVVLEAMEYSLTAGGKRLRPILVLEFYRMCGGEDIDKMIKVACSVELIHTYSLIHDDLPCMDNDDFRRGKPSCHKAFSEDIALLAGDALNTLAFEVITDCAMEGTISAETAVMLVSVLSKAIGTDGMIGGQVIDLETENEVIDIETLNRLQSCKTGALIEAACVMGVVLSGKMEYIPAAADYAQAMGRAFQIVDDILDVTGTFEELGKPIGSDSEQHKNTYVSLLGLQRSRQKAAQLTVTALGALKNFENNEFVFELTRELLERRS